jgi:hypothetical protein
LLVVMSPESVVLWASTRMSSRDPLGFRQERVGRGGELFEVLKLHTMIDDAHLAVHDDPCVTPLVLTSATGGVCNVGDIRSIAPSGDTNGSGPEPGRGWRMS